MSHTIQGKKKLINRIRRLRGQLNAVEAALGGECGCSEVLMRLAACRGAFNALISEIIEGHVRNHVIGPSQKPAREQKKAAEEVIAVVKKYMR